MTTAKVSDKVQMGDSTTGTTTTTTTGYYMNYNAEKGWECPRCKRINAPWVRQCDCSGNNWSITCGDNDWMKRVYCDTDTFRIHPGDTTWKTSETICPTDSATQAKMGSNQSTTLWGTSIDSPWNQLVTPTVGGSDYWNPLTHSYENVITKVSNSVHTQNKEK